MRVITNPKLISKEDWSYFIQNNEYGNVFHTYEYYCSIENAENIKALFLAVVDDDNKLLSISIGEVSKEAWDIFGLSKRAIFYSEPAFTNNEDLLLILSSITIISKSYIIQIRPRILHSNEILNVFSSQGFVFEDHLNSILELKTLELNWSMLQNDKKRGVKQARTKYFLNVIESKEQADIDKFYQMMSDFYKDIRHPFKNKSYFNSMIENFGNNISLLFVVKDDLKIATQLVLKYKSVIYALYTATNPNDKDKHAGDLIIWYLIENGINDGFLFLDLGGGGQPNKFYGPREYKKRFGTSFHNVGRLVFYKYRIYVYLKKLYLKTIKMKSNYESVN